MSGVLPAPGGLLPEFSLGLPDYLVLQILQKIIRLFHYFSPLIYVDSQNNYGSFQKFGQVIFTDQEASVTRATPYARNIYLAEKRFNIHRPNKKRRPLRSGRL
jgi:hypothetical protein